MLSKYPLPEFLLFSVLLVGVGIALATGPLGWDAGDPVWSSVVWSLRLPRVCLALTVGASLGVSGALAQGLFRNPLADPGLIGIASGAALAAALTFVLFGALSSSLWLPWVLAVNAFAGALLMMYLVMQIARWSGSVSVLTLLLGGVAINALASSAIGLLTYLADDSALRNFSFWMLGSVVGANWQAVLVMSIILVGLLFAAMRYSSSLNAMLIGESEARHLGFPVELIKHRVVLLLAIGVGGAVANVGMISFIGLVAPHCVRMWVGPDHRRVIPLSALLGGCILVLADCSAKNLLAPAEIPIGIVTSLLGAPFFLWLIVKYKRVSL
ncbi:MAG TPA: iron ABC transporter permease [Pseudomonadales bacterium]|nr:iron ABC transporter permease [Pseudomonadales bacterium]